MCEGSRLCVACKYKRKGFKNKKKRQEVWYLQAEKEERGTETKQQQRHQKVDKTRQHGHCYFSQLLSPPPPLQSPLIIWIRPAQLSSLWISVFTLGARLRSDEAVVLLSLVAPDCASLSVADTVSIELETGVLEGLAVLCCPTPCSVLTSPPPPIDPPGMPAMLGVEGRPRCPAGGTALPQPHVLLVRCSLLFDAVVCGYRGPSSPEGGGDGISTSLNNGEASSKKLSQSGSSSSLERPKAVDKGEGVPRCDPWVAEAVDSGERGAA